jgi:hypothetical protein
MATMNARLGMPLSARSFGRLSVCLSFVLACGWTVAHASSDSRSGQQRRSMARLQYDPAVEKLDVFEGVEDGSFEVAVVPRDEKQGMILVDNKTDRPLTVELPDAFVGVQVLNQTGAGGDEPGTGVGPGNVGSRGAQPVGGGMRVGARSGGPGGMWSIPPEKSIRVPYQSVCLAYGRPTPKPRMTYRMVPVDQFTDNPTLQELIRLIGGGRLDQRAAQAAAWHLTDGMNWQQLAVARFHPVELVRAQQIVATAAAQARERSDGEPPPRRRNPAAAESQRTR